MKISHVIPVRATQSAPRSQAAFTMVEIALCLAIIGFALVAIIGVLPTGLNVQKDNREETIIGQDAMVWMDAIRSGARSYDDLTNHVLVISNLWTMYTVTPTTNQPGLTGADWYTPSNSSFGVSFALTNGLRIIGLLSMPKTISPSPYAGRAGDYQSNYVVAYIRGISGPAVEKFPQMNEQALENAFSYRMIVENLPYVPVDFASIDLSPAATNGMSAKQYIARLDSARLAANLRADSRDVRLTFRWPVFPNGETGNHKMTFRHFVGGRLWRVNDVGVPEHPLYYFLPSTYIQAAQSP